MKKILYLSFVCMFLAACATVPQTVSRPWNRTLTDEEVPTGASVSITVETIATPLLGSEELVEKTISGKAAALLQRRGFSISDSNPQYRLRIAYKVTPGVRETTSYSSYSGAKYAAYSRNTNLGVILAQSVSAALMQNVTRTQATSIQYDVFSHLISCELIKQSGQLVWKYDSGATTGSADILGVYTPLLQVALSSLPTTSEVIPRVRKIKEDRFNDFADLYLRDKYYMCPALPNYITLLDPADARWDYYAGGYQYNLGIGSDRAALMAVVDLVETAEYAIPKGSQSLWKNPMDKRLWTSVTLMGRYLLGSDDKPVNVVVGLEGKPTSYVVKYFRLVSDNEYQEQQERYNQWIAQLKEFYDFFED